LKKLLAFAFVLFLLLIAYWADSGTMPGLLKAIYIFPNGDKVGHAVLYGTLTFLLNQAWPQRKVQVGKWSIPLGTILALLGATFEELSQFFFPGRTPDIMDLSCGFAGIIIATFFSLWVRRIMMKDQQRQIQEHHEHSLTHHRHSK
jgi:VanZ family protein